MPLHPTQTKILETLKLHDTAMTVKMLANELEVTGQTIRNHVGVLMRTGRIEIYSRGHVSGATAYVLTESGSININPITWSNGEMVSIRELFEQLAKPESWSKNPYWHNIQKIILKLYEMSIAATDDDNPQPVKQMELRELRKVLETIREQAQLVRESAGDLLNYDELWNPRELPKTLIVNDLKLDIEKARDIIDRIEGA